MDLDSVINNCCEILAFDEAHGVYVSVCPSGNYDFVAWYPANATLVYYLWLRSASMEVWKFCFPDSVVLDVTDCLSMPTILIGRGRSVEIECLGFSVPFRLNFQFLALVDSFFLHYPSKSSINTLQSWNSGYKW